MRGTWWRQAAFLAVLELWAHNCILASFLGVAEEGSSAEFSSLGAICHLPACIRSLQKNRKMGREKKKSKKAAAARDEDAPSTSQPGVDSSVAERLELQRTRVVCGPEMNYNVGWAHARMHVHVPHSLLHVGCHGFVEECRLA